MAWTCPFCGKQSSRCNCAVNFAAGSQTGMWFTSPTAWFFLAEDKNKNVTDLLPEHSLGIKEWLNKLKQFVDLPTEYPEEFEKRSDIQIYLVAIHELDNISLYKFLVHVYYETQQNQQIYYGWIGKVTRGPARAITVLDAFVIREYCNRYLIQNKVKIEREEKITKIREKIYQEEWYKKFPEVMRYRLETAIDHRIEQRLHEQEGLEESAKIAYNNFHQALAYEQSFIDDNFFPDEFDKGPDMSMQHNQRIAAQIQIVEGLVKRNQLGSKEGKRQIKELEKQYR